MTEPPIKNHEASKCDYFRGQDSKRFVQYLRIHFTFLWIRLGEQYTQSRVKRAFHSDPELGQLRALGVKLTTFEARWQYFSGPQLEALLRVGSRISELAVQVTKESVAALCAALIRPGNALRVLRFSHTFDFYTLLPAFLHTNCRLTDVSFMHTVDAETESELEQGFTVAKQRKVILALLHARRLGGHTHLKRFPVELFRLVKEMSVGSKRGNQE